MVQILIVDDSETIRKMVELVLTNAGYSVTQAADGAEGLERFSQGKFALVISDINMPRMNGLEFIQTVREIDSEIPILALTTEAEEVMRQKGAEAGADGWIVKPFKPAQFLDIVRQVLA